MKCADLDDRLFDEDCRAALLERGRLPADIAAHTTQCPSCRAALAQAAMESGRLSRELLTQTPPALRGALYRAFPGKPARLRRIDADTVAWIVAGGALGASLLASLAASSALWQTAGFCVGASSGLVASALQKAGADWRAPWASIQSTASRCVERLVHVI